MLNFSKVQLEKLIVNVKEEPLGFPSFLFLGRSNVGKSTLLNALCFPAKPAFVSQKPGKTQTINFYLVDNKFYLVDIPGYGYAKRSEEDRRKYGKMIYDFLEKSKTLKLVVALVDFNVGFTKDDLELHKYLLENNINFIVAFTKLDKTPVTHQFKQKKLLLENLKTKALFISSTEKKGIDELKEVIVNSLNQL